MSTQFDRHIVADHIQALLVELCQQKSVQAKDISTGYARLWQEIEQYLAAGGKRIRPYLMMLAYRAYGGQQSDKVMPVAAAWELMHASLLVHDDIIDRDVIRHGRPNIAGRYKDIYAEAVGDDLEHYASSTALLAGSLLLDAAYQIVRDSELDSKQQLAAMADLQQAYFTVAGGELHDLESVLHEIEATDPLQIALDKTASYSFVGPLVCGARLAGASADQLSLLTDVAEHIGVGFQLKDDLLGVYGDSQITGKSNRTDIYEKKRTLLVVHAYKAADDHQRKLLRQYYDLQHSLTDSEVDAVIEMLDKSGAEQYVESIINDHAKAAIAGIQKLDMSRANQQLLCDIVSLATVRQS